MSLRLLKMSTNGQGNGALNHNGQSNGIDSSSDNEQGFNSQSLEFVEQMYERFVKSPDELPQEWRDYFEVLLKESGSEMISYEPNLKKRSMFNPASSDQSRLRRPQRMEVADRQERLDQLIRNFRVRGHIHAEVDPLGTRHSIPPEMRPEFYGFTEEDYDRGFSTSWLAGPEYRTLRQIVQWLKTTYCRSIGVQFMHIDSLSVREWLQSKMESTGNRLKLTRDEQLRILTRLSDAVLFEEFVQKKFLGKKRFSLEGAETLIPLLDLAIEKASEDGVKEIVFGMAHRGRLTVLANILQKSPRSIFREFVDADPELHIGRGDVKYHMGYSSDWTTAAGKNVHLSLCFNPSHLEFINPVALGRLRAKQDKAGDKEFQMGLGILIHGDAAFAGEGVVQETLNLSELPGYKTGGTIHVVVNNQIGFTTSPDQSRSSTYATDVAKMLQIPIFHVNGEDPEAVAQVVRLALDFRKKFKRDVVIDMYCYRRHGHNESDEPAFTQPIMYRKIKKRPTTYHTYLDQLLRQRGVSREEADEIVEARRANLENEFAIAQDENFIRCADTAGGEWVKYEGGDVVNADDADTSIPKKELTDLLIRTSRLPRTFHPHPKIERLISTRLQMAEGVRPFDWGGAEAAALATLVAKGVPLRMSGQDVERGTFSHRHSVLHDYENGEEHCPLKELAVENGLVEIYNSPLSEAGVLGFDYGYSLDLPEGLVIWEAQFGDFANAAQVIFDQFIVSAEDKWKRLNGLVMLLPHGFEGQGPEHSSARLERFLTMAAEDNIQITNVTTPAQYFHLLRRQVMRKWKKPLVVMTPKSLLRHKLAVSSLEELTDGHFQTVIQDTTVEDKSKVQRILMCSGKVYYDLFSHREENNLNNVAIIRLEELYPLPYQKLNDTLSEYPEGTPVVWVQEEPENMGASRFLRIHFGTELFDQYPFQTVERPASASPATGSAHSHAIEQKSLLEEAFRDM